MLGVSMVLTQISGYRCYNTESPPMPWSDALEKLIFIQFHSCTELAAINAVNGSLAYEYNGLSSIYKRSMFSLVPRRGRPNGTYTSKTRTKSGDDL